MSIKAIPFSAILMLCFAVEAFGFNAAGHKIIAEITWQKLSPAERTAIVAILRQHPRFDEDFQSKMPQEIVNQGVSVQDHWIFCQAGIWPDIVRGIPQPARREFHRPRWHYINLPVFLDEDQANSMGSGISVNTEFTLPNGGDMTLLNGVQAVKNSLAVVMSLNSSDAEKAVHYCWLIHVIPDLAQPLHSAALFTQELFPEGDKGGNSIKIQREGTSGNGQNLHSVWDSLLGKNSSFNEVLSKANQFIMGHPAEFSASFVGMPVDVWSTESQAVAIQSTYGPILTEIRDADENGSLGVIEVPASYFFQAGAVAQRQAVTAGVRLAGVLAGTVPNSDSPTRFLIGGRGIQTPVVIAVQRANQVLDAIHRRADDSVSNEIIPGNLALEVKALRDEIRQLRRMIERDGLRPASSKRQLRSAIRSARMLHEHDDDGEQCDCGSEEE